MALWVLEATARTPIRLPDGSLHQVRSAYRTQRHTDFGRVFVHTFLIETLFSAADPTTRLILEALIPTQSRAWDVEAKPAPDGTYPDLQSRSAVVVRDGAIVAAGGD